MKAIIPAAGIGTRLRPHTYTEPKVLLHVAGKPMLAHILDELVELGIDEVVIVVGPMGEKITDFVRENYKFKAHFVEQKELLGLGHAVKTASKHFDNEPALIILGDTIFEADLKSVINSEYDSIGTKHVDDPRRFGIAEVENGFITELIEKPPKPESHQALVGLYYIKRTDLLKECLQEIVDKDMRTKGEYQLTDALQLMVKKGAKMTTFNVEGWYDCGNVETTLETNHKLLAKLPPPREIKGSTLIPPVYVSPSVKVENSIIGPDVSIADEATIKHSIIRNSIISQGASVSNSILESSLIGKNAQVSMAFGELNVGDSSQVGHS
ncbi:MAG: sugar phosphate nucleotidyltransferase [Candidatus Zixiibacteriota bacterium]